MPNTNTEVQDGTAVQYGTAVTVTRDMFVRAGHSDDDDWERDWSPDRMPAFMSPNGTRGPLVNSDRIFSAELECYPGVLSSREDIAADLPPAVGVSHDGSLNAGGFEVQTPQLRGANGEEAVHAVCNVLSKYECTVGQTTGLHIHLDGEGLLPDNRRTRTPGALQALLAMYITYEPVLLSFLPRSRRGNQYARRMALDFHIREIVNAHNVEALEKLWYRTRNRYQIARRKSEKYDNTRYFGLNLHSLFKDGHVEIRYHSGTISAEKILQWVNLHCAMLDVSAGYGHASIVRPAGSVVELSELTETLFNTLKLSDKARAYWRTRQNAFIRTAPANQE